MTKRNNSEQEDKVSQSKPEILRLKNNSIFAALADCASETSQSNQEYPIGDYYLGWNIRLMLDSLKEQS
jgi:parvulin-like peptidyl-prolyl isomerase